MDLESNVDLFRFLVNPGFKTAVLDSETDVSDSETHVLEIELVRKRTGTKMSVNAALRYLNFSMGSRG